MRYISLGWMGFSASSLVGVNSTNLTVLTTSGIFRGSISNSSSDVAQFLSIPYAEAQRFSAPVLRSLEPGINSATTYGVSCGQYLTGLQSFFPTAIPDFGIFGSTGEDCLTLSIWVPTLALPRPKYSDIVRRKQSKVGLSVIVYIPGGRFILGGTNVAYQLPERWVQRTQKHIVVTMNWRLNIFGFPNAKGMNQSTLNLGFLDQRIAMEWIQQNIASFGGDPARITLWGQSAGAASVDAYNFAYSKDPIASAFILDSGTAFLAGSSLDTSQSNFSFVASNLGCQSNDTATELACMQKVPFQDIEDFLKAYNDNRTTPVLSFAPIADNRTHFQDYPERAAAGMLSDKPAIIGTNSNEGASLLPYSASGPSVSAMNAATNAAFACPAIAMTKARYSAGRATYRYLYNGKFSNISPLPWEGAYHCSELPLVFGTHFIHRGNSTPFEYLVGNYMQDVYFAFINNHTSLPDLGWPVYASNGSAMHFVPKDGVVNDLITASDLEAGCV